MNQTASAFFGEPALKDAVMAQLRRHHKLDQIKQEYYWDEDSQSGCHLGCLTHTNNGGILRLTGETFGIGERFAELLEHAFEAAYSFNAANWVLESTNAIPLGADVRAVSLRLGSWLFSPESEGSIFYEISNHPKAEKVFTGASEYLASVAEAVTVSDPPVLRDAEAFQLRNWADKLKAAASEVLAYQRLDIDKDAVRKEYLCCGEEPHPSKWWRDVRCSLQFTWEVTTKKILEILQSLPEGPPVPIPSRVRQYLNTLELLPPADEIQFNSIRPEQSDAKVSRNPGGACHYHAKLQEQLH